MQVLLSTLETITVSRMKFKNPANSGVGGLVDFWCIKLNIPVNIV